MKKIQLGIKDSTYLYRHVKTLPKIYATNSIRIVKNSEEALNIISRDSFNPNYQSVLTLPANESPYPDSGNGTEHKGVVDFRGEYTSYQNNSIIARVILDRPGMVIFDELYFPGWQATVDGQVAPLPPAIPSYGYKPDNFPAWV